MQWCIITRWYRIEGPKEIGELCPLCGEIPLTKKVKNKRRWRKVGNKGKEMDLEVLFLVLVIQNVNL